MNKHPNMIFTFTKVAKCAFFGLFLRLAKLDFSANTMWACISSLLLVRSFPLGCIINGTNYTHFFFVCSYFKYWPSNTCIFICALYYENIWEGTFPALQTYANIWQTWNCRRSAKNPRLAPKLAVQAKRRWWELLCIIYSLIVADLEFGIFDLYTVPYVCTILYGQPIELISTLYHVTWRVLMRFHFWFDIIINCIGGFYLYHDRHLE